VRWSVLNFGFPDLARRTIDEGGVFDIAAARSDASLPLGPSVFSIVAGLEGHDLNGLCRQWCGHFGGEPPVHLSRLAMSRRQLCRVTRAKRDRSFGLRRLLSNILLKMQSASSQPTAPSRKPTFAT
jgi:hypothetical protein